MNQLTIVGLGPGSKDYLTLEALDCITEAELVYVRTMKHPVMSYLQEKGGQFEGYDHFYEEGQKFEEVYQGIADDVMKKLEISDVIYAVPGNPFVAESTVEILIDSVDEAQLRIIHGASFIDAIVTTLRLDPVYGLKIMDGLTIDDMVPDVSSDALIIQVYDQQIASNIKLKLMTYYDDDQEVIIVRGAGIAGEEVIMRVPLFELDRVDCLDHLTSVYIEAVHPEDRTKFFLQDLEAVMTVLRSPDGCPWDREQSHESLKRYLIEEAYEVIEAIDDGDLWALEEELGDLLLQVVFHAEIARENGYFNIIDVITGIYEKMVRRHPHVFSDTDVEDSDEVLDNWEQIKAEEKETTTVAESIDKIAKSFPPILRAEKVMKKMAKAGFDYEDAQGAFDKIEEELEELKSDLINNPESAHEEFGDVLFAIIDLGRLLKIDPSVALNQTINKVIKRFAYLESQLLAEGKVLKEVSLEKMNEIWQKSKKYDI